MLSTRSRWPIPLGLVLVLVWLAAWLGAGPVSNAKAQAIPRTFPQTGKTLSGRFLAYWDSHGGLAQQGYPISETMLEASPVDGKVYTVQYFERAVFEYHPENRPPNDVLLSLLGSLRYKQKYPGGAPNQAANTAPGSLYFPETGHRLGGRFLAYWQTHGGLAQQGYPVSDEFSEVSDLNGKTYTVQYYQRAVFEYHPENQPPFEVLLSHLGTLKRAADLSSQGTLRSQTPTPRRIYWGAYIRGNTYNYGDAPYDMRSVAAFEADAGKGVSLISWGEPWYHNGRFQQFWAGDYDTVRAHGSIPVIDWRTWDYSDGVSQPAFTLAKIIRGDYDDYITQWATDARNWGHPFFIRLDCEMNGDWYPWSEKQNGNRPGEFVQMWRHVHDIFTRVGTTNATWIWNPNTESKDTIPLEQLYPGDNYVDWVGIDGYNWGTNPAKPDSWKSFSEVFTQTYNHILSLAPGKPIIICETGSTEYGGSKAQWISDAAGQLQYAFPHVAAVVWFNWNADGMDWVIESSTASTQAFKRAIALPIFARNEFGSVAGPLRPLVP